jgi:hypothetical protein
MEPKVNTMRSCAVLVLFGLLLPAIVRAEDGGDRVVSYLEQYHQLRRGDIQGRLRLAEWCEDREMLGQQVQLLTEVLKLDPESEDVYSKLLDVDAKRTRGVDPAWARKLESLLGDKFHLHHSRHFTLLSDVDEQVVEGSAQAMEDAYAVFYRETVKLGMRPMPPAGRLVCVLFNEFDQYHDFERRYELADTQWATGVYSWRTNRTAFFYEQDHPALKEAKANLSLAQRKLDQLRAEMESLPNSDTAGRLKLQSQVKHVNAAVEQLTAGIHQAIRMAMAAKTSHEATHQLLYNSGLEHRGRDYPFWFNEGLATLFEVGDPEGHAGPGYVNHFRLMSYREAQQSGHLIKLEHLLTTRPSDRENEEIVAGWYAQAWAFAHFLWTQKPATFVEYWKDVEEHEPPKDWKAVFARHFGDDIEGLQSEFRAHVDSLPK